MPRQPTLPDPLLGSVSKREQHTPQVVAARPTDEIDLLAKDEVAAAVLGERSKPWGAAALRQNENPVVVLPHARDPQVLLGERWVAPHEPFPRLRQSVIPILQPVVRPRDLCGASCARIEIKGSERLPHPGRRLQGVVGFHGLAVKKGSAPEVVRRFDPAPTRTRPLRREVLIPHLKLFPTVTAAQPFAVAVLVAFDE